MKMHSFLLAIAAVFFLTIPRALAEDRFFRSGWWGAIDIGAGFVQRSFKGSDEDGTNFFLGLEGGVYSHP